MIQSSEYKFSLKLAGITGQSILCIHLSLLHSGHINSCIKQKIRTVLTFHCHIPAFLG